MSAGQSIIAYAHDGEVYCVECAGDDSEISDDAPIFAIDEYLEGLDCSDCNETLIAPVWEDPKYRTIALRNSDEDPTHIYADVSGPYARQWADHHGALDGGTWESCDRYDDEFVYDILYWHPGLIESLEKEGYDFDFSEYSEPDEDELAIAQHASECEACEYDYRAAEKHVEEMAR